MNDQDRIKDWGGGGPGAQIVGGGLVQLPSALQ